MSLDRTITMRVRSISRGGTYPSQMTLVEVDPAPDVPATLLTISPSQSEILELDIGQTFTLTLAQLPRASVNVSARSKRRTDDPR